MQALADTFCDCLLVSLLGSGSLLSGRKGNSPTRVLRCLSEQMAGTKSGAFHRSEMPKCFDDARAILILLATVCRKKAAGRFGGSRQVPGYN